MHFLRDDQDIYFLCDLETGDIKKYIGKYAPYFKYYSTTTSCIEDNVLALSMYGEDNQFYVCLINADTMKEIADPIAGESFSMEDKTLLIDQKELYDLSGTARLHEILLQEVLSFLYPYPWS